MKNKAIILTSVALMLLILMPVNVFRVSAAVPNPGVLIGERIGEPMYADPVFQYDVASLEMLMNIYEPLIFFNGTSVSEFIGIIADSWYGQLISVTDPITGQAYKQKWVFHIRPNVHFHYYDGSVPGEGDLLTPADVEYSFERNMVVDSSLGGELLIWGALGFAGGAADLSDPLFGRRIDFSVQSDANTVTFYLVNPFEPFLQIVAQMYGAIFSKTWSVSPLIAGHSDNWDGIWPNWALPNGTGYQNYDRWQTYHDPTTSPLEVVNPHSPGPKLDFILGTGPYMFNYWNKGDGGQYSLIKNPAYWGGWSSPAHVDEYLSIYISSWETRKADFLTGACDECDVPRMYMDQVLGQPGIRCLKNIPELAVDAAFLNAAISSTSTYCGTMPPNGTFTEFGFPQDGFSDLELREAFRALFPYDPYLLAAFLGEATHPATCVIPGLAYFDAGIATPTYNRALAVQLLQQAWGGALWTGGFLMDFYYNTGNEARRLACEMLAAEFDSINAEYGTKFHAVVTAGPWSGYSALWRARVLPFYIVGWAVDYPDADDFVTPFMQDTIGTFAKYQGIVNATIDDWIAKGIATIIPSERQGNYSLLQQGYIDNCYSFTLDQATGRRWERDWVDGWFFNSIYSLFMTFAYYYYKQDVTTKVRSVSSSITMGADIVFDAHNTGDEPWEYVHEHIVVICRDSTGARTPQITSVAPWVQSLSYSISYNSGTDTTTIIIDVSAWLKRCIATDLVKVHLYSLQALKYANETVTIHEDWNPSVQNTDPNSFVEMTKHCGDLGGGVPPAFFAFDGQCSGKDLSLFLLCFKGTAPAGAMYLGDFGGGVPPTMYNFDGKCDGKDLSLFLQCFKGTCPP